MRRQRVAARAQDLRRAGPARSSTTAKARIKIRGIYQWVDKRYSLRVLNYGKRLMYDVVVPEPAAFLIQALKNAVQPERFQLTKPIEPNLSPSQLNVGNYVWYAAQYGVTGLGDTAARGLRQDRVTPGTGRRDRKHFKAYGAEPDVAYQTAFKLTVPEDYKAVSGYVQHVNVRLSWPCAGRHSGVHRR